MAGIERHTFGGKTSLEVTTPGFGAVDLRGRPTRLDPQDQPSLPSEW